MIDEVLVFLDGRTNEVDAARARADGARGRVARLRARRRAARRAARISSRWRSRRVVLTIEGGDRDVRRLCARRRRRRDRAHAHSRRQAAGARASVPRELEEETDAAVLAGVSRAAAICRSRIAPPNCSCRSIRRARARRGVARAHEDPRAAARSAARARRPRRRRTRGTCSRSCGSPSDEAEERAGDPIYELQRAARPAESSARARLLRHLARAGHGHGRVVRLVPERAAVPRRVPQVQGEDGRRASTISRR